MINDGKASLTQKNVYNGNDGQICLTQKNVYNGNGQRIRKTETGESSGTDKAPCYYYQGDQVLYTAGTDGSRKSFHLYGLEGNVIASGRYGGSCAGQYLTYSQIPHCKQRDIWPSQQSPNDCKQSLGSLPAGRAERRITGLGSRQKGRFGGCLCFV